MKYAHHDAYKVALEMRAELAPFVSRIEIVGSLRRMRPLVRDFELLFIPRIETRQNPAALFDEPLQVDLADEYLNTRLREGRMTKRVGENGTTAWGAQNKLAVDRDSGMPCDFFSVPEENWWMSLVIRTGGKASNLEITQAAIKRGEHAMAYGAGYRLQNGKVYPMQSERQVFEHVGLPYREPQDRP